MTTAEIAVPAMSEGEHRRQLRRAVIASTVGTTIEWYDFLLYGQVTGLVFGKLFFPPSDPMVGILQAFAIFFIGFVGRPIGAAIFGHWGDRIGRKATLIVTLLVTGIATVAVGLVPTYDSIGIWGAVLLTLIRLIQGIGVGGEWGGSVLLAMEWARTNKNRGFISAWPQFGGPAGLFLANLAVLFFSWLADPVPAQHHHGRDRSVDPPGHPRNPGFPEAAGRGAHRARAGMGSHQAATQADRADRTRADAGAGAGLHRRHLHLHLRHDCARRLTRFHLERDPRASGPRLHLGGDRRLFVGLSRPQEDVYDWCRDQWVLGLRLFRSA